MEIPVVLEQINPRAPQDVAAMAIAVQANLAALKVASAKRVGMPPERHEIRTPPPGAVRRFREVLIDRHVMAAYGDQELAFRTRQVWGEFAVLCWMFGHSDPHAPPDFFSMSMDQGIRCAGHTQEKCDEVQRGLWRLRWEQRFRFEPAVKSDPLFQREYEAALAAPMMVYGQNVRVCSHESVLLCACEYAGMLAALRWSMDERWAWEAAGIMDLQVANPGGATSFPAQTGPTHQ